MYPDSMDGDLCEFHAAKHGSDAGACAFQATLCSLRTNGCRTIHGVVHDRPPTVLRVVDGSAELCPVQ